MKQRVYNIFLSGFLLVLFISDVSASNASDIKRGNKYYHEGKFDQAAELYEKVLSRKPNVYEANYNLGTTLYKKGDFDNSIEHFQKALLSDNQDLLNKAQYNLGNAYFKKSEELENVDVDAAIAALEKGIGYYDKASPRAQKDKDMQQNYKVFKDKLEELKKKRKKADREGPGEGELEGDKGPQGSQNSSTGNNNNQSQDGGQGQNKDGNDSDQSKNGSDGPNKDEQQDDQQNQQDQNQAGQGQGESDQANDQNQSGQTQGRPSANNDDHPESDKDSGVGNSGADQGEMTPQEAQMMLDDYQRNDEPKGMLYFKPQPDKSNPVVKDW